MGKKGNLCSQINQCQIKGWDFESKWAKRVTFAAKLTNVKSKAGILKANGDKSDLPKFKAEGLLNLKKAAKMREKKEKKERARRDIVATELSDNLENAFESLGNSDKYDFEKDFEIK